MQGKTEGELLSWLAGFLDGEGSFPIIRVTGRFPQPRIQVNNTHYPTLPVVTEMLDQLGLPYYVFHKKAGVGKDGHKRQPQWGIAATGLKRCDRWCRSLLPYLITRREKAELMLEYCNSRLGRDTRNRWVPGIADLTLRETEIVGRLNAGNWRPGPSPK